MNGHMVTTYLIRLLNIMLLVGIVVSLARGDYATAAVLFLGLIAVVMVAGLRLGKG